MDADRWLGSTGAGWPCFLANSGAAVTYADEASAAAEAARSSMYWLPSQPELTTCTTCVVCRPSYIDVGTTESSSSLLKPAAATPDDLAKQINDTG